MLRALAAFAVLVSLATAGASDPDPLEPLCESHPDYHGKGGWSLGAGEEIRLGASNYDLERGIERRSAPMEGEYHILTVGTFAWTLYSDVEETRGLVLAQGLSTPTTPAAGVRDLAFGKVCLVVVNVGPDALFDAQVS